MKSSVKLMTHIVAGYPNFEESERIAVAMYESGVSFVEVQIPFSDPIADGPTIMKANEVALRGGVSTRACLEFVERLVAKVKIPILIMTYFNIAFSYGLEKFCKEAARVGVYGLIIPDMPIDEEGSEHYIGFCRKYGLHPIQVVSPITPAERLRRIRKVASGFVYCVSTYGTTGARSGLALGLEKYLARVRRHVKVPLAVGFGISTAEQVAALEGKADIAVIGSKIIDLYDGAGIVAVKNFLEDIC